jgi:hypothetical protein
LLLIFLVVSVVGGFDKLGVGFRAGFQAGFGAGFGVEFVVGFVPGFFVGLPFVFGRFLET